MTVNPTKEKKLTNIRAAGSDRNILLKPPRNMSLEESLEYIEEDELVEVTPEAIRLRKLLLSEHERRKHARRQPPPLRLSCTERLTAYRGCRSLLVRATMNGFLYFRGCSTGPLNDISYPLRQEVVHRSRLNQFDI